MHFNSTLKRKTPLRRKPLSSLHPRKRQQELERKEKPRKPLKKVSKSQRKKLKGYKQVAKEFLSDPANEYCGICIARREHGEAIEIRYASEIHHKFGRAGSNLSDPRGFVASCFRCREFPHANPELAREWGILGSAAQWNVPIDRH